MRSRIVYHGAGAPRRGKKIHWGIPALVGGAILLVLAGIAYIIRLPLLQVHRITLIGVETLEEAALRERIAEGLAGSYAWILPRSSFFFVSPDAVASDLEKEFPRIEEARVEKGFPDVMSVAITERLFWGVFCSTEHSSTTPACAYLDPSGVAYERAPEPEGKLIIVVRSDRGDAALGTAVVDRALMGEMRTMVVELAARADILVSGFVVSSRVPGELRAIAAEGFTLIFARGGDIDASVGVLKRVLEKEVGDRRSRLEYVDLRLGNKVFYKLR